jgi:transcriptional regulator with XRE-family HTH domain
VAHRERRYQLGGSVAPPSTTALKWWLAVELRRLRESRGIRRERAAEAIRGSVQAIGHIETGRFLPRPLELDKLLELYGVPDRSPFFQELRNRAKKGRDWWVHFGELVPREFDLFLGLESSAVRIDSFDCTVVPGPLQTAAYAESVVRGTNPGLSDADVAKKVELRMARQQLFLAADGPPTRRVIAEAALRLQVGGADVMREQLASLTALSRYPTTRMQVLLASAGAHMAVDGSFTLLSAPPGLRNYSGCVHVETLVLSYYYEEPTEVAMYRDALEQLQQRALNSADSVEFIAQLVRDL